MTVITLISQTNLPLNATVNIFNQKGLCSPWYNRLVHYIFLKMLEKEIMFIFRYFFQYFYISLFSESKLEGKLKPWCTDLILELTYCSWSLIRNCD